MSHLTAAEIHKRVSALGDAELAREGPGLCQQLARLLTPTVAGRRGGAGKTAGGDQQLPHTCAATVRLLCRAARLPGLARDLATTQAAVPRLVEQLANRIRALPRTEAAGGGDGGDLRWLAPAFECAAQRFPAQCGHVRGRLESGLIRLLDRPAGTGAAGPAERLWSLLPKLGGQSAEERSARWSELDGRCLAALAACHGLLAACAGCGGGSGGCGTPAAAPGLMPDCLDGGAALGNAAQVRGCASRARGLLTALRALLDCPLIVEADVRAAADLAERLVGLRVSAATSEARCLAAELPAVQAEAARLLARLAEALGLGACVIGPQLAGAVHAGMESPPGPVRLAAYGLLAAWLDHGRSLAGLDLLPAGGLRGLLVRRLLPDAAAALLNEERPADLEVADDTWRCGVASLGCLARLSGDFRLEPAVPDLLWRRLAGPLSARLVSGRGRVATRDPDAPSGPAAELSAAAAEFLAALGRNPRPGHPWPVERLALALGRLGRPGRRLVDGLRDRMQLWASPPLWTDELPPLPAEASQPDEVEGADKATPLAVPGTPAAVSVEDRPPPAKMPRLDHPPVPACPPSDVSGESSDSSDTSDDDDDHMVEAPPPPAPLPPPSTSVQPPRPPQQQRISFHGNAPEAGGAPSVYEMLDCFVDND